MGSLKIEESKTDECSGFRSPEDCPHEGLFTKGSEACRECWDDVLAPVIDGWYVDSFGSVTH